MAYDFYPAMDEDLNFPPEVQAAIARSVKLGEAVPDIGTPLGAALSKLMGAGGGLQGVTGVSTFLVAGTLIAQANGGWAIDNSEAGKSRSLNIDSVALVPAFEDNSGSNLKLNFTTAKGTRLVSAVAKFDAAGSYASTVEMALTNVTPTSAVLAFSRNMPEINDYIYYDPATNTWMSSLYTSFGRVTFQGGKLTIGHTEIDDKSRDRLSITPRGNKYRYNVHPDANPVSKTQAIFEVRENEPASDAYIQYDGVKWVSSNPDKIRVDSFVDADHNPLGTQSLLTLLHPPLSAASDDRIVLTPRGPLIPSVSTIAAPLTNTQTLIEFIDTNKDAPYTIYRSGPQPGMRFYIQRGGSTGLAPVPTADMKFYFRHGGGTRYMTATEAATLAPGARISFMAVVEK